MALLGTVTVRGAEDNDTTVINNARKVVVIAGDSLQQIRVMGREGDDSYVYRNTIQLVDSNYVSEQRTYRELNAIGWSVGKKNDAWRSHAITLHFGLGVSLPTAVPGEYKMRPFKSFEGMLWLQYDYTPKKRLQTYSVGLGFTARGYGLRDDQMFNKDADGITGLSLYPENTANRRSRISVYSLSIPFFFTQKFGQKSHVKLTLGPVLNINGGSINSYFEKDDRDYDYTIHKIGIRPVTVDLMAVLRYYGVGLYFKYSPMSVLKSGRGPQFHALSLGVYF